MSEIKIIFETNDESKKVTSFSKEKLIIDLFELMCYIGEPNIKFAEKLVNTIYDELISNNKKSITEKELKIIIKSILKQKSPDLLYAFIINKNKNHNLDVDLEIKTNIFKYLLNLNNSDVNSSSKDLDINSYLNSLKNTYINLDESNQKIYNNVFKYIFEGYFYPSVNILKNINSKYKNLLNSYSVVLEDNLESIFENLKISSQLQKRNCAISVNLSNIRSQKKIVTSTSKKACGPNKIIDLYYSAKNLIGNKEVKNTNNLFYIDVEHEDILEFIKHSQKNKNNNFAILINNRFMQNLINNCNYIVNNIEDNSIQKNLDDQKLNLKNKSVKTINPNIIIDTIINSIYNHNNIDLVFIDHLKEIDIFNNYKPLEISAVGYQPVFKNDGFVSGVIDVSMFVTPIKDIKLFDWKSLKKVIFDVIEFLDLNIDLSKDLNEEFETIKKDTRRIYLSITGYAKLLDKLNIPYQSQDSLLFGEKLSEFISYYSKLKSIELAKEKGPFNKYIKSKYDLNYFEFENYNIQKTLFTNQKLAKKLLANRPKTDWVELKNKIRKYGIRNSTTYSIIFSDLYSIINDTTNSINCLENINYEVILDGVKFSKFYKLFLIHNNINLENLEDIDVLELIKNKSKQKFTLPSEVESSYFIKLQRSFSKYCDGVCNSNIFLKKEVGFEKIKELLITSYKLKNKVFLPKIIDEDNKVYFDSDDFKSLKSL